MKIASSNAEFISSHHSREVTREAYSRGSLITGLFNEELLKDYSLKKQDTEKTEKRDSFERSEGEEGDPTYSFTPGSLPSMQRSRELKSNPERDLRSLHEMLMVKIIAFMESLMEKQYSKGGSSLSNALGLMKSGLSGHGNPFYAVSYERYSYYHHESESTTFNGKGQAVTEDGRVIDFNLSFGVSRTFTEEMDITSGRVVTLTDPLVINFGDSTLTEISDKTFFFDIDSDGVKDEIHGLSGASGFLALDRNGNGTIDDGSELFGTKSGDGFSDLEKYDEDGNGWIDENDSIYSKLKIWCRDEDGNEALYSLKERDIGAIFLDRADTELTERSMSAADDFAVKGKIRKTGVFLKESGGVGSVQQVDLARN